MEKTQLMNKHKMVCAIHEIDQHLKRTSILNKLSSKNTQSDQKYINYKRRIKENSPEVGESPPMTKTHKRFCSLRPAKLKRNKNVDENKGRESKTQIFCSGKVSTREIRIPEIRGAERREG